MATATDDQDESENNAGTPTLAPTRAPILNRLGIVGLGLVGGSIALAARRAFPELTIVAVDRDVILEVAQEQQLVDEICSSQLPATEVATALATCDLVILCTPVLHIERALVAYQDELRARGDKAPVVTDTGSTKAGICAVAEQSMLHRFIGGHPMAGKAQGGLAHADAALFEGATWFLCPTTSCDEAALRLLRHVIVEMGAHPVEIDADEHDLSVALTSHLPHVLINALAEAVLDGGAIDAAGGSLRSVLHIAGAPVGTWTETLRSNGPAVRTALLEYAERITTLADELDDAERLKRLFARGRACRERVL